MEKRSLGKGLSALIPPKEVALAGDSTAATGPDQVVQLKVSQIKANKYQPRVAFKEDKLKELTDSIQEKGVVQPVLVRKSAGGYELIAGERRLRAVTALGYETIPAIVKEVGDLDMLELALIENIQREGLNAIEEAGAFQRFITDFNFSQDRIAQALGKDRSTVANALRLLGLPRKVQELIAGDLLSAGHGKVLLSIPTEREQLRVADLAVRKGLSVRETENLVARKRAPAKADTARREQNIIDIEESLQRALGTRVRILHGKKRGRIQIEYYSSEDLNRILDLLEARQRA